MIELTYNDAVLISAYTGFLMCDFSDLHKIFEDVFDRPVFTHEFASEETLKRFRKKTESRFKAICEKMAASKP